MPTYTNPVHDEVLADPFVLKWNGRYFAYGTPAIGPVPVLTSTDLVTWTHMGDALPAPAPGTCYWAPEVAYDNGTFFMFYSVGAPEGEGHQVRLATSRSPLGPFTPAGPPLDPEAGFSIDASPFRDGDGQWYLFSCRDFLDGERVGTGIVVHRLVDMRELGGEAEVVVRPHAEWHLYERSRNWYRRVWDWYTVEGPFVVRAGGSYWCFFSGGAWRGENYGVSWAFADHPLGPWKTGAPADGAEVLRSVAGAVGPGHASIVMAPDNVTPYLVYHAWDPALTGRRACIDALLRDADGRPVRSGPTTTSQPAPPMPEHRFLFGPDAADVASGWELRGHWGARDALVVTGDSGFSYALPPVTPSSDALVELNAARTGQVGSYGAIITSPEDGRAVTVELAPERKRLLLRKWIGEEPTATVELGPLPDSFAASAYHQMLLEHRGGRIRVLVDGVDYESTIACAPGRVGVFADRASVAFDGISCTRLE